jgi:hypothetical protein
VINSWKGTSNSPFLYPIRHARVKKIISRVADAGYSNTADKSLQVNQRIPHMMGGY